MKNLILLLAVLLPVLTFSFCKMESNQDLISDELSTMRSISDTVQIGQQILGTISLSLSSDQIDSFWNAYFEFSNLSDWNNIESKKLTINDSIKCSESYRYLVFSIIDNGVSFIDALMISKEPVSNGFIYNLHLWDDDSEMSERSPFRRHSCSGDPCSFCKLQRGGGFLGLGVTGCLCEDEGGQGHCNHTVEAGDPSSLISILLAIL